jgi:cell division protein FtsI (penicillin-binding protein 3)
MARQVRKVIVKESTGRRIIEQSRIRLLCVGLFFLLCFGSISARMIDVAVIDNPKAAMITVSDPDEEKNDEVAMDVMEPKLSRGNITDRNGVLIATSLMTQSLFANPKELSNINEAANRLGGALGIDGKQLATKLTKGKTFVWVKRNLTPREQQAVNSLGIPGIYFYPEERRVYPYGSLLAHALGYVGVDNHGLGGIEKKFDQRLRDTGTNNEPLALAIDVRLQAVMHEEVQRAVDEFRAIGAAGVIMDLKTGELLSMVSLPDFDPHKPSKASDAARFNRVALGTYEMGSTFKSFTMAMGFETGTINMKSVYDTTNPLKIGGFTIQDAHPLHRPLTVPEIYAYSSNIGAAKVALDVGGKRQREFLEKIGMMHPVDLELPEKSYPLYPKEWKEINTVTISYGHGISVSPLQLVRGIATLADGGIMPRLTLLKDGNHGRPEGERIVSEQTSKNMRRLFRLVVDHGTASKADVPGYRVGGKTGTAEKNTNGVYSENAKLASFIGIFPVDEPRYVILVMVDEPKGDKSTSGFATGGWISAPVVANVISRMGPMLALKPEFDTPGDDAEKFWVQHTPPPKPKEPVEPVIVQAAEKTYVNEETY